MKKRILLTVLAAHLLISVFFSFDLPFLTGDHFGFFPTFLIIYAMTLPLVIGALAAGFGVYDIVKKRAGALDKTCVIIGAAVLATYACSALGIFNGITGIVYAALPIGALAIICCEIVNIKLKNKN